MRKVVVTDKNEETFLCGGNEEDICWNEASILETVDELLHDKGLELVIGDNGNSKYSLKISPTKIDEEYDRERAHTILHDQKEGILNWFET